MGRHQNKLAIGLLLCVLGGCARGLVPVIDLNQAADSGARAGTVHTVVRGDSLHAIAWQYGLNYRQLAAVNGIAAPYTIYPGQKLNLSSRAQRYKQTVASAPAPVVGEALSGSWHWPAQGAVVARQGGFGRKKGIDISGKVGQAVFSAKGGKVVYSGNGIRGYGNLLIVKHDEEYLSAYAYNQRLLVAEGDRVKVGQKIAEIGTSGATREAKLHFEIRRDGKAVDPLSLLPKRQNNVKI